MGITQIAISADFPLPAALFQGISSH